MPITKEELILKYQFYVSQNRNQLFTDNKPETKQIWGQLTPINANEALQEYGMKPLLKAIMYGGVTLRWPNNYDVISDELTRNLLLDAGGDLEKLDVDRLPRYIESKQKVQRLLIPRFEVLQPYSTYRVGTIVEGPIKLAEQLMLQNPHAFKKLDWWQYRTQEDMYDVFYKWWDEDEQEEVVSYRQPHSSIIPEPASRSEYKAYMNRGYDQKLEEYIKTLLCT